MYDLAVIGAGWAGFNAAIKAKEAGLKACLIDAREIGGTCLNRGCIPTKTLLASAKILSLSKKSSEFGACFKPEFNYQKIQERKNKVINGLSLGMQSRLKGIDFLNSKAELISANKIKTAGQVIESEYILIATGSYPFELPQLKFDGKKIISSDDALVLNEIPDSLLIVGGGFIGCEFANLFFDLGSKVMLVEKAASLLPGQDKDIVRKLEIIFKKKGIGVQTGSDISKFDIKNYSKVLVCVGRAASLSGFGIETLGIRIEKNKIWTDEYLRTNIANIYAAGDCTSKFMLAHYAAYQGKTAAENIISKNKFKADNQTVPSAIFTEPQIASVGLNEEEASLAGMDFKINKFDFRANAMAHILGETEGFIKVISGKKTQELIGACIIGPLASELIAIFGLAISMRLTIDNIRKVIFAHPSLSESVYEVF